MDRVIDMVISYDPIYELDGQQFTARGATVYLMHQGFNFGEAVQYKKLLREEAKNDKPSLSPTS